MPTSSIDKPCIIVRDQKAFEQFKNDIETKSSKNRTVKPSKSLERGRELLKHFSIR